MNIALRLRDVRNRINFITSYDDSSMWFHMILHLLLALLDEILHLFEFGMPHSANRDRILLSVVLFVKEVDGRSETILKVPTQPMRNYGSLFLLVFIVSDVLLNQVFRLSCDKLYLCFLQTLAECSMVIVSW